MHLRSTPELRICGLPSRVCGRRPVNFYGLFYELITVFAAKQRNSTLHAAKAAPEASETAELGRARGERLFTDRSHHFDLNRNPVNLRRKCFGLLDRPTQVHLQPVTGTMPRNTDAYKCSGLLKKTRCLGLDCAHLIKRRPSCTTTHSTQIYRKNKACPKRGTPRCLGRP